MSMTRPLVRGMTRSMVRGIVRGGYTPPAPYISAPLDVTWIEGTNPPEFVMNVKWVGDDAVQIGDIPQVRYNGAGTVYDGDAVVSLSGNPTFSGLPTQPDGPGYAQFRYVRDPGGPGEVIGAWSSSSEGQFDISAADTEPAQFGSGDWSVAANATVGGATITITTLPDDGGSAITDIEFQVDGGAWASIGGTTTGAYDVTGNGLTAGVEGDVAIRAVNAVGNGTASATKAVTPLAAPTSIAWDTPPVTGTGTFSNSDKTFAGTADFTIRSTDIAVTGKIVSAFQLNSSKTYYGPALSAAASPSNIWNASNGLTYLRGAGPYTAGGGIANMNLAPGATDTIGFVVDAVAKKLWVTKNGTDFLDSSGVTRSLADVIAGVGGYNISAIIDAGTTYICAEGVFSDGNGSELSIVAWPWTLPTGYTDLGA